MLVDYQLTMSILNVIQIKKIVRNQQSFNMFKGNLLRIKVIIEIKVRGKCQK